MALEKGSSSSSMNVSEEAVAGDETSNSDTEDRVSVLVVDDDATILSIHKALLCKMDLDVEVATDGQQAVTLHQMGSLYDLIFMDMDMPVMNGPEATRKLRAMGIKTMIVGVTSRNFGSDIQDFLQAGLNYCIVKPLTIEKVTPLIGEVIRNM